MRLPDTYYTSEIFQGIPQECLGKQPYRSPVFSQGEDIVFTVYLEYEAEPVNLNKWTLVAPVKKSRYDTGVVWCGELKNGIEQVGEGLFMITIPSEETSVFPKGTYFMDLKISQPTGSGDKVDIDKVLNTYSFTIEYTPSSPNPENIQTKSKRTSWEKSIPLPSDTINP